MKIRIVAVLMFLFSAGLCASDTWDSSVTHQNRQRDFKVFVPSSYDKSPLPLVLVLHGGGGNNNQIQRHTGFSRLAEKQGFFVAYPQGFGNGWNDGREDIQSKSREQNIDDVGFIMKMLAAIKAKYKINASRIYVCGISNGGFMSMRLACEVPGTFAAAGIVCATLNPYLTHARPDKKISVLIMNGTEDPLVPYAGGYVKVFRKTRGKVLGTDDTIKYWLSWDRCGGEPFIAKINPDTTDNTEIEKYSYECGEAEVILYKVIGGGHTWPGGSQYLPEGIVGRVSRDINATEVLWGFFKGKTRR